MLVRSEGEYNERDWKDLTPAFTWMLLKMSRRKLLPLAIYDGALHCATHIPLTALVLFCTFKSQRYARYEHCEHCIFLFPSQVLAWSGSTDPTFAVSAYWVTSEALRQVICFYSHFITTYAGCKLKCEFKIPFYYIANFTNNTSTTS